MTLSWALTHECINRAQLGKFRHVQSINIAWDTLAGAHKEEHLNLPIPGKMRKGEMIQPNQEITCYLPMSLGHAEKKPSSPQKKQGWENGGNGDRHFLGQQRIRDCKTERIIIWCDCCLIGSKRMKVFKCIMSPGVGPRRCWQSMHKWNNYWMFTACWDCGYKDNEGTPAVEELTVSTGKIQSGLLVTTELSSD